MHVIVQTLLLSTVAGGATLFGVFLGNRFTAKNSLSLGTAFAAGIMLLTSVFELLPEAAKTLDIPKIFLFAFFGAVVLYIAGKIIPHIHTPKDIAQCSSECLSRLPLLLAVGVILHDFPEGLVIPSSFSSSASLGYLVVIATLIHNIPEGYVLTVASRTKDSKKIAMLSGFMSLASTLFGSIVGLLLLGSLRNINAVLLSITAGAMLFISLHELLPTARKFGRVRDYCFGFACSVGAYIVLAIFFN